ncbi:MAG: SpoIIE family protein phosphatase [Caldilineaceae bacterium]|nr:SpoIIE family protein phosphatase [Caldilineaceae bacterium]
MNTQQMGRRGYIPLKYQVMGAILLLVIPVLILLSVSNYLATQASLRASDALLQAQTEAGIRNALKQVDIAYKIFEQPLEPQIAKAFPLFLAAYAASGGQPELVDLAAVKQQAEALTGLEFDLYIIDAESVIDYTTDADSAGLDFKVSSPDMVKFLAQVRQGDSMVSNRLSTQVRTGQYYKFAYAPTPDHRYVLEYGVVIHDLAQFAGDLDPLKLAEAFKTLNPAVDQILLYDYKGRLMTTEQKLTVDQATQTMIQEITKSNRGTVEIVDAEQQTLTRYFLVDLPDEGMVGDGHNDKVVAITYNSRLIDAALTRQTRLNGLISLAAVVLLVGITYLLSAWLSRPILHLNQAARNLARGEWQQSVPVRSRNEVGELARSFEQMAGQLHELVENLEHKVAERTAALAAANHAISHLNEQLQSENLRLSTEIEVTQRLQRMILPKAQELQEIEGLEIAGYMEPADEVGGDYYDVLHHNGHVKIGIGDVTGHGLESGVLMLMTQMGVRTLLTHDESNPVQFMDVLNRTLYHNVQRMGIDKSLTLALLDYQPQPEGGYLWASGQHEELIVVRQGGVVERIDTLDLGFPIGLDADIADFIGRRQVTLGPGDGVVLYTDGITEAENAANQQYGLERLCETIRQHWVASAEAIKQAVIDDVRQFIGEQTVFDDITLLVLKQK